MLLLFVVASALLFVWPPRNDPGRADAVVVLSGDHGDRLGAALQLMHEGVAPVLVHDGTPDSADVIELCRGGQAFEVVCLRPVPDSTRAEARAAAKLVTERGWRRIVVVTSTYHATRAGLLFRRCVAGDVIVVASDPQTRTLFVARQVAREWLGTVHSLTMARSC